MAEAKKMVTVLSKFDSIHTIGTRLFSKEERDAKGVTRAAMTIDGPDVRLLPGLNEVPAHDWALAADPKSVVTQFHLRKGKLKVLSSSDLPDDEDDAIELVKATIREDILRRWEKDEARPDVQNAIEDQLTAIRGEKKRVQPNPEMSLPDDGPDEE